MSGLAGHTEADVAARGVGARPGRSGRFLSRGTNHLANLASQLGDLSSHESLIYELIQNADDAGATEMSFDLSGTTVVVSNNAAFSACQDPEGPDCTRPTKPMCDFHSFREVASGNKSHQVDTTGAFGIGFTAVYRICDHPEILSRGLHWILDESAQEDQRIHSCPGECDLPHVDEATVVVLPLATTPSPLRGALKAEPVDVSSMDALEEELARVGADALLFLRHLTRITTSRNGTPRTVERILEGDTAILADTRDSSWWMLNTTFEDEASQLRTDHPAAIPPDRASTVTIALADDEDRTGMLYAGLPTQEVISGIPLRIDAAFFPTRDRRSVHLEQDARSTWNRAAIRAAATAVAESLEEVCRRYGPVRTWQLVHAAAQLGKEVESGVRDKAYSAFWSEILVRLPQTAILPTQDGSLVTPDRALVPRASAVHDEQDLLKRVGLPIADRSLRSTLFRLEWDGIGLRQLKVQDVVDALIQLGVTSTWDPAADDAPLTSEEVARLVRVIDTLVDRVPSGGVPGLQSIAIVRCRDGRFATPTDALHVTDDPTLDLVAKVDASIPIVDDETLAEVSPFVLGECRTLTPSALIDLLERAEQPPRRDLALTVLRWLAGRRNDITNADADRLISLPLVPTTSGVLAAPGSVALPGDFEDPFGLADIADMSELRGVTDLLAETLDVPTLDVTTYLADHVAPRLVNDLTRRTALGLLDVIAEHLHHLRDEKTLATQLGGAALVPCSDGTMRPAHEVYARDARMGTWGVPIVAADVSPRLDDALSWLGVADEARPADLNARARWLAADAPTADLVNQAELLVQMLNEHPDALGWLKAGRLADVAEQAWMPAKDGGRHRPSATYAGFDEYLASSQGPFVALGRRTQQDCIDTLTALGVHRSVPVRMILNHIETCIDEGRDIHQQIYTRLGEAYEGMTASERDRLMGLAFIQTGPAEYRYASEVYWDEAPFGPFSARLSSELRRYYELFEAMGVKNRPDCFDATQVLQAAAKQWRSLTLSEDQVRAVHAAWTVLASAIEADDDDAVTLARGLADVHCIPDRRNLLERPSLLFFRDHSGIGERSELLQSALVERRADTRRAYAAAGVRVVTDVLDVSPAIAEPVSEDDDLEGRVRDRTRALRRLFESDDTIDTTDAIQRLARVRYRLTPSLALREEIHAFRQVEALTPRDVSVWFDSNTQELYRSAAVDSDLYEIAGQLAPHLLEEPAPGLASGIAAVLSAVSADAADTVLSHLGVPLLNEDIIEAAAERVADTLGAESVDMHTSEDPPLVEAGETDLPVTHQDLEDDADDTTSACTAPDPAVLEPSPLDLLESRKSVTPEEPSLQPTRTGSGTSEKSRKPTSPSTTKHRLTRLVSYVRRSDNPEAEPNRDRATNPAIDRAGVEAVLDYERRHGRQPEELQHSHPGHDVVSRDHSGDVLRRIEVKSTEEAWGERGVALSRRQYEDGRNEASMYWLYVVEYALDDARRALYCIQDPANSVDLYVFDDGWQAAAAERE